MRKHYKIKHPKTLSRRISDGLRRSQENPSYQDMVDALQGGVRDAIGIYKRWTEAQYQHMKRVMDALEPVLPVEIVASWKAIEAFHDFERD